MRSWVAEVAEVSVLQAGSLAGFGCILHPTWTYQTGSVAAEVEEVVVGSRILSTGRARLATADQTVVDVRPGEGRPIHDAEEPAIAVAEGRACVEDSCRGTADYMDSSRTKRLELSRELRNAHCLDPAQGHPYVMFLDRKYVNILARDISADSKIQLPSKALSCSSNCPRCLRG